MHGRASLALAVGLALVAAGVVSLSARHAAGAGAAPPPGTVAEGKRLYLQAGCGACHGLNGQGTKIAPSVRGHTPEQVHRQARAPLDQMPAYSPARLSDANLDRIAAYVASLEHLGPHVEPVQLPNVVATHHLMAIIAIKTGNRADALHHVEHIIDSVKGEHLQAMRRARRLLRAGELHDAEHLIESMLAGRASPRLSLSKLHLQLALAAIEGRNRAEALHHVGHFLARAKASERRKGQAVLAELRRRDLHEAEHGIEALLGLPHD